MEVEYNCLECGTKKWVIVKRRKFLLTRIFWQDKYLECDGCGSNNDVWKNIPPIRHLVRPIIFKISLKLNTRQMKNPSLPNYNPPPPPQKEKIKPPPPPPNIRVLPSKGLMEILFTPFEIIIKAIRAPVILLLILYDILFGTFDLDVLDSDFENTSPIQKGKPDTSKPSNSSIYEI